MSTPEVRIEPIKKETMLIADLPEWTWARVSLGSTQFIRFRVGDNMYGEEYVCIVKRGSVCDKYKVLEVLGAIECVGGNGGMSVPQLVCKTEKKKETRTLADLPEFVLAKVDWCSGEPNRFRIGNYAYGWEDRLHDKGSIKEQCLASGYPVIEVLGKIVVK